MPEKDVDPLGFARLHKERLSMDEITQSLGVSRATLFNRNDSLKPCSV